MPSLSFGTNVIQNAHFGDKEIKQVISGDGTVLYKAADRITAITFSLSNVNNFGSSDVGTIIITGTEGATGSITGTNGAGSLSSFTIDETGTYTWATPNVSSNQGAARSPKFTVNATGDTVIAAGVTNSATITQSACASGLTLSQNSSCATYSVPSGTTATLGFRTNAGHPFVVGGKVAYSISVSGSGTSCHSPAHFCDNQCRVGTTLSFSLSAGGYCSVGTSKPYSIVGCLDTNCDTCSTPCP